MGKRGATAGRVRWLALFTLLQVSSAAPVLAAAKEENLRGAESLKPQFCRGHSTTKVVKDRSVAGQAVVLFRGLPRGCRRNVIHPPGQFQRNIAGLRTEADGKPWWPASQSDHGGRYCGLSQMDSKRTGSAGSRDGPIRVHVSGPGLRVRLGSDQRSYRRGEVVYARMENIGTERIYDPPEYQIDRLADDEWERVGPNGFGWPRSPSPLLTSGRARCINFRIPKRVPLGFYRVVKRIEYGGGPIGGRSPLLVSRRFQILRKSSPSPR